jgi:hypothetical protein
MNHQQIGHQGDISALSYDFRLAKGDQVFLLRNRPENLNTARLLSRTLTAVEQLVLEKNDRVVHPDSRFQESFGVIRVRGTGYFEARDVHEKGFQGLCVLSATGGSPNRSAHNHGNTQLAS